MSSAACRLVLSVVAVMVLSSCSETMATQSVTIENGTRYDVEVEVSDPSRETWTLLGRAPREGSSQPADVEDLGDVWVFRFSHGDRTVLEVELSRDELRSDDWRVEVPSAVEDRLEADGVPASVEGS